MREAAKHGVCHCPGISPVSSLGPARLPAHAWFAMLGAARPAGHAIVALRSLAPSKGSSHRRALTAAHGTSGGTTGTWTCWIKSPMPVRATALATTDRLAGVYFWITASD